MSYRHHNLKIKFCLLWFTLTVIDCSGQTNVTYLHNIDCQPLLSFVDVDPNYLFDPYVVRLYRCGGKQKYGSRNKVCVAKTTSKVTFHVDDFSGTGKAVTTTLVNHTSCQEECKYDRSICNENQVWDPSDCSCRCNVVGPQECEEGFRWDPFRCSCVCPPQSPLQQCNQHRVFSEDTCSCMCEPKMSRKCTNAGLFFDPETCLCTVTPPNTGAQESRDCTHTSAKMTLIVVSFGEAFLILAAYVMWRKYCGHRDAKRCCKKKENMSLELQDPNLSADRFIVDTPTIDAHPGLTVVYTPKQHNNNKLYGGKHNSPSCDALLSEQNTEYTSNGGGQANAHEWRQSFGSTVKV